MTDRPFHRLLLAALALSVLVLVLFGSWPWLDLGFSGLFTDAAGGFPLAQVEGLQRLNLVIRRSLEGLAYVAVLATLLAMAARLPLASGLRCWQFIAGAFVLGPGLIVNALLKEHWGRARPADVLEFGGAHHFTPVLLVTDQCRHNCSFSSGEVAMSATFVFVTLVLVWPRLGGIGRGVALAAGAGFLILSAGLRITLGRHFLSDALVSTLISALVVLGLYRLLGIGAARAAFGGAELRRDLALVRARLAALAARLIRRTGGAPRA